MLLHKNQSTDGAASDTVVLTDRTVENTSTGEPVNSGIRLGSDGVLREYQAGGGRTAIIGEWLVSGTASTFFVQRTILDGTLQTDPGTGFLQLNVNRDYINLKSTNGTKVTSIFLEISSDVSGVPLVATATHTYTSIREGS